MGAAGEDEKEKGSDLNSIVERAEVMLYSPNSAILHALHISTKFAKE